MNIRKLLCARAGQSGRHRSGIFSSQAVNLRAAGGGQRPPGGGPPEEAPGYPELVKMEAHQLLFPNQPTTTQHPRLPRPHLQQTSPLGMPLLSVQGKFQKVGKE